MGEEAGSIHLEMAQKVFRENRGITYEWEMPLPEGKRYFQTTLSPVRDEKGNCIEIVGVGREITSLRLALEEVQVRLEEKNLLLREIQHRVQNNLQVIISLLNLQLQEAASDETKEEFQVAISRIHTFSELYGQLQDKEDVAHIRMDLFLLSLASRILDSGILQERPEFQWETEEVSLPLDKAITVGLIFNEIISGYIEQLAGNEKKVLKGTLKRQGFFLEFLLSCEGRKIEKSRPLYSSNPSLHQELIQSLVMHTNGTLEYRETEIIVKLPVF